MWSSESSGAITVALVWASWSWSYLRRSETFQHVHFCNIAHFGDNDNLRSEKFPFQRRNYSRPHAFSLALPIDDKRRERSCLSSRVMSNKGFFSAPERLWHPVMPAHHSVSPSLITVASRMWMFLTVLQKFCRWRHVLCKFVLMTV